MIGMMREVEDFRDEGIPHELKALPEPIHTHAERINLLFPVKGLRWVAMDWKGPLGQRHER